MSYTDTIVLAAEAAKQLQIDHEEFMVKNGEWSRAERGRDCVALIRGMAIHKVEENKISASVPDHPDAKIWGYLCAVVLDLAAADFNLPETAEITDIAHNRAILSW